MRDTSIWVEMSWERPTAISRSELVMLWVRR